LAVLHHDTGQLEAALACAREAAELGEGLTDAKTKLETINALGTVLTAAGDHRGALAAFHRSLDLAARTGAAYWSAEARLGVAITLEAAGRRRQAVQAALLAVSEAELGGYRLVRDRALAVTRSQKKS
ncbi:MAG: tetratricopeptide repeat protein, partial [Nonomuraea sp.]|nr:tetratricopeptide repeat protein [Nonomuraea sp.]